jgi:hypothetical protein
VNSCIIPINLGSLTARDGSTTVGGAGYRQLVPDPTAYLATMAGGSATLVAIIGGLRVSKFVGLDVEQQTTRRQFHQAETKAKRARYQLQLTEQRHEDQLVFELATNEEALGAIASGLTDYDALRRGYRLSKPQGEQTLRLTLVIHEGG